MPLTDVISNIKESQQNTRQSKNHESKIHSHLMDYILVVSTNYNQWVQYLKLLARKNKLIKKIIIGFLRSGRGEHWLMFSQGILLPARSLLSSNAAAYLHSYYQGCRSWLVHIIIIDIWAIAIYNLTLTHYFLEKITYFY